MIFSSWAISTSPLPPPNSGSLQKKNHSNHSSMLKQQFEKFKQDFAKKYTSKEEESRRFRIFSESLRYIAKRNKAMNESSLGINYFADFTLDEFASYTKCVDIPKEILDEDIYQSDSLEIPTDHIPSALDMRYLATPVKDQRSCGSCWAFATIAAVETFTAALTDELIPLSEQELVDCAGRGKGCIDGVVETALEYIKTNGIASARTYPYSGYQGICARAWQRRAAYIDRYERVPSNENALFRVVGGYGWPVTVNICANDGDFQHYNGRHILRSDCTPGSEISHSVTIFGYYTSTGNEEDYWIIRNSWGPNWGENGYARLKMGVNLRQISSYAWLPVPRDI